MYFITPWNNHHLQYIYASSKDRTSVRSVKIRVFFGGQGIRRSCQWYIILFSFVFRMKYDGGTYNTYVIRVVYYRVSRIPSPIDIFPRYWNGPQKGFFLHVWGGGGRYLNTIYVCVSTEKSRNEWFFYPNNACAIYTSGGGRPSPPPTCRAAAY